MKYLKMTIIKKRRTLRFLLTLFLLLSIVVFFCLWLSGKEKAQQNASSGPSASSSSGCKLEDIPDYQGEAYVVINENRPSFSEKDFTTSPFEHYSNLDSLGRCSTAYANVCPGTLPKEERGAIGEIHPSGWQIANYHDLIEDNYLFNRCHLIAFSLTGENANETNLITGTRYLNTEGMQPFELEVLEYVRSTGNHVLYRVTPLFNEDDLVAAGVEMEGMSVEDRGEGISFHIFAYNVQPGVIINYKNGDNKRDPDYQTADHDYTNHQAKDDSSEDEDSVNEPVNSSVSYILNRNTHKFHKPSCPSVSDIKDKNKISSEESREKIMEEGYEPCGQCKP